MVAKLQVKDVFKIFGNDPKEALRRLRAGQDKQTIFETTGQTVGVQEASFEVEEGQIFVVMGLSGSGKSTVIRTLNALHPATSGTVEVLGRDLAELTPK